MIRLTFVLCAALACVHGYKFYQDEVPNGDRVPHPCKANYQWPGLGHKNELGGGTRNPFGLDFAAAGHKWTTELCNKDSDGDGKSNGVELGDPSCAWTKGSLPANSDGLSHPGICEPIDSPQCANGTNDWDFCKLQEFSCNATEHPDVQKLTIQLDQTNVPAKETTYICQHFKMPTDQDYHVIAAKPDIDNDIVMHHILIFACISGPSYKLNDPHECGMSNGECSTQITGWSVGDPGSCLPDQLGFLIGKNSGYSHLMLQMHWNNPQKLSTYQDKSGMSLYMTPNLRTYSTGTFLIGQLYMNIPPGQDSYEESATCQKACTSTLMEQSFYIWSASVHMHYLGRSGMIEHYRNGQKIGVIVDTPNYSYDRPEEAYHTPPIEFKPGDEMKMKCEFKSTSRSDITHYGDGTQDEMCYGFIGVYPTKAIEELYGCIAFKDVDLCEAAINNFTDTVIGGCNIAEHFKDMYRIGYEMWAPCNGLKGECPPECKKYVDNKLKKNPCRQKPALDFFTRVLGRIDFVHQLEVTTAACDQVTYDKAQTKDKTNAGMSCIYSVPLLLLSLVALAYVN